MDLQMEMIFTLNASESVRALRRQFCEEDGLIDREPEAIVQILHATRMDYLQLMQTVDQARMIAREIKISLAASGCETPTNEG